jgi:hypothetical protein
MVSDAAFVCSSMQTFSPLIQAEQLNTAIAQTLSLNTCPT